LGLALWSAVWNPVTQHFGAAAPVFGSVMTTLLALVFAVPLAFGIAFWLVEMAPAMVAGPIGMAVQLLAAVPSIIFGMWGFFVIVPVMAHYVQPWARVHLGHIPGSACSSRGAYGRDADGGAGAGGDGDAVCLRGDARRVRGDAGADPRARMGWGRRGGR
jgi:ABC-type phosphate transport system permease subunit